MERQTAAGSLGRVLFTVLFLIGAGAAAHAQTATFARTDYPFPGNDHIVADFDRDGRIDIAGTGLTSAGIMRGNGDGTFQPKVSYPTAGPGQALAAGDFNGDAIPDLMVTINDPDIGLSLLLGRGDGSFDPALNLANVARFDSPAVAAVDLNNDGHLDTVVGHGIACYTAPCVASRVITLLPGNGNGTFQPPHILDVGLDTAAIGVGDFNRDGLKDVALASSQSRVQLLINTGGFTFAQRTLTLIPEQNLGMDNTDIDAADVNHDGLDDLVVALSLNGSRTVILRGNGDGTFGDPHFITEPSIRIPQYQAVADYNGDGRLDLALALAYGSDGLMEIRNGNGDGTFGPVVLYLVPPALSSIGGLKLHSADFNNDGKADIALAWGGASSGMAALRNTTGVTPPPRPAAPSLRSPASGATVALPVTLDWSDVAHAVSYEVQIDNSSTISSPFVANFTVIASQATVSGLPAQRLWWRVRARNSAGVFGPFSSTWRFTPQAASAPASLSGLTLSPSSVTGGAGVTGTVTLTSAAPAGGAVVALSSTQAAASVPASVTVAPGAAQASFGITTSAVSAATPVTIAAGYNGVTRSAALTVNPPGQEITVTVTATGRSGEQVLSSPSGIRVSVGSTGSATFAAGTSITLSVTDERDAIWSGACSSGGDKRRTCTFTPAGSASVNANVQ